MLATGVGKEPIALKGGAMMA
ncbi:hypothetical protein Tco_1441215, partial [Tanacetum coccineum]